MIIRNGVSLMRNGTAIGLIGLCLLSTTRLAAEGQSVMAQPTPNAVAVISAGSVGAEQWGVFETSFTSARKYDNPILKVQAIVVFRSGDQQWLVPAIWAGGDKWNVCFSPPMQGDYTFQIKCSDPANQMVMNPRPRDDQSTPKDKTAPAVHFKQDVPSPQDWVLMLERLTP